MTDNKGNPLVSPTPASQTQKTTPLVDPKATAKPNATPSPAPTKTEI